MQIAFPHTYPAGSRKGGGIPSQYLYGYVPLNNSKRFLKQGRHLQPPRHTFTLNLLEYPPRNTEDKNSPTFSDHDIGISKHKLRITYMYIPITL